MRLILIDARVSGLMETEPIGVAAPHPPYLNKIIAGQYGGAPRQLLESCLSIESRLNRTRDPNAPKAPRTADVDILLFGDVEVSAPNVLIIPHPEIRNRRFCLEGLMSIGPSILVPMSGRLLSIKELYENMSADVAAQNVSLVE